MCPTATRAARHRWHLDYIDTSTNVSHPSHPARLPAVRTAVDSNSAPPGFPLHVSARHPPALLPLSTATKQHISPTQPDAARAALQAAYHASWSVAFAPARTLLTSAFALYMTGTSVQFFTVATTLTVLLMHFQSMFGLRHAFRPALKAAVPLATLVPQVFVHLVLTGLGVAMGLYKAHLLGFLPTTQSDWISWLPPRTVDETYVIDSSFLPL